MPTIELETRIKSNIEICFDLSRSIDLHKISTAETNEEAIAGRTSGLIDNNEFVTWQATHFGVKQKLSTQITAFERPFHFRDEQISGPFAYIIHDHYFSLDGNVVIMKDVFNFQSPFGILGKLVDKLILTNYLRRFLVIRNETIKTFAESSQWKEILTIN